MNLSLFPVIDGFLWPKLRRRLQRASIFHSRRVGLLHEQTVPDIRNFCPEVGWNRKTHLYFVFTPHPHLTPLVHDLCPQCYSRDIRVNVSEGIGICAHCGFVVDRVAVSGTSFTQSVGPAQSINAAQVLPRSYTPSYHKRVSHFKYWLARIQGKENAKIRRGHLNAVREYLLAHHIDNPDYASVRQTLRVLRMQRFYDNTYFIIRHVTGKAIVDFHPSHEKQLLRLFLEIQQPFANHCFPRVNMLSYSYLLRKFTELLGWSDVSLLLPPMKSISKLRQQDLVWKHICRELGWDFMSST